MLVLRDKALGARVKELISRANAKRNDQGGSCLYDIPPQDDDDDDDDDEVGGGEASGNAGNAGGSNSGNTGIQSQNEGNEETPSQEKKDAGATDEEEPRILEALEASILRCAIDCINAERDAVTKEVGKNVENVAEVADNVDKVYEVVEEIRKEVAVSQEVVDPVFSSLELVGAEFEKPNFKVDDIILMDFDIAIPESTEAFVLQVAREITNDNAPTETADEMENLFEKSMNAEMKDAGVYKAKIDVLRSVGATGTSGLGKVTSGLAKRVIKIPAYLCSPFLQHFGSSSKESVEATDVKCLKGICPLDTNIGNLPAIDQSSDYYNWLDKGLLMTKNKKKFYSKEDNDISPPIKLGCEIISEKTWFHTIGYGSSNFSNSHDEFFYYLRLLSKYSADYKMNFTTSDCKLQKSIASLYADISESDDIQSKITAKQGILDVLNGVALPFSTPWYLVLNQRYVV
ncbi:hypothetical protein POM88_044777 [Heracleum sosnowskyi]|uniref:Uncharacterized protein n=1 Tax=Heracleum sosnowskyi TaxID=360622 RepID=A0AAD8M5P6_9APIA|nr:hypothetical protein POM88_044777 [Heracleum sosnowskyi]